VLGGGLLPGSVAEDPPDASDSGSAPLPDAASVTFLSAPGDRSAGAGSWRGGLTPSRSAQLGAVRPQQAGDLFIPAPAVADAADWARQSAANTPLSRPPQDTAVTVAGAASTAATPVASRGPASAFAYGVRAAVGSSADSSAPATPRSQAGPTGVAALLQPVRVLVVDDEAVNRRVLSRMLRSLGVGHVIEVTDGDEVVGALAAAAAGGAPVDVVLMDIIMKRMHGTEATQLLLQGGAGLPAGAQPPPVVCVSANTAFLQQRVPQAGTAPATSAVVSPTALQAASGRANATAHGATYESLFASVLPKPFSKQALERVLVQVLGFGAAQAIR
jgi:CheY-like chemotaxis protein